MNATLPQILISKKYSNRGNVLQNGFILWRTGSLLVDEHPEASGCSTAGRTFLSALP
jgi:hypothetical protein